VFDILNKLFRAVFPPEFTVTIRNGIAESTQGKITHKALSDFTEVAQQQNISQGTIVGVRRDVQITLEFSSDIPQSEHQRFRNAWGMNKF